MRFLSSRQAWHDAFTISYGGSTWQLMDPRRPRWDFAAHVSARAVDSKVEKSNMGQIINAVEQGYVQGVIERLPPMEKSWGMYAYVDPFDQVDLDRCRQWLYRIWVAENPVDYAKNIHLNYRRHTKLLLSIDVALEGVKQLHITGEPATPSQIGEQIGVKNPTRDGWILRVHEMSMLIDTLDRRALGPLAKWLKEVNDDQ